MITAEDRALLARSLRHATDQHTGAKLDAALDELGWHDAVDADPRAAISAYFELQGETNVISTALDHVVRTGLGLDVTSRSRVVMPAFSRSTPPGAVENGEAVVRGLGLGSFEGGEVVVAVASDEGIFIGETTSLEERPITGIDPGAGLVEVTGRIAEPTGESVDWGEAVRLAHLAIGHELVGSSRTMLALAREHALERIQFGRPIAMFQAVRHRLAETLVAIEAADSALGAAWDAGSPTLASMAKALAGRSAGVARTHCQQVLAGIGFTAEHEFHHFLRRTHVLDGLFGDTRTLTKHIGATLIRERAVPPAVPL